jgi:hypothetical protein
LTQIEPDDELLGGRAQWGGLLPIGLEQAPIRHTAAGEPPNRQRGRQDDVIMRTLPRIRRQVSGSRILDAVILQFADQRIGFSQVGLYLQTTRRHQGVQLADQQDFRHRAGTAGLPFDRAGRNGDWDRRDSTSVE